MNTDNLSESTASDENEPENCFNFFEPGSSDQYYNANYVLGYRNGIVYSDKNWKFRPNCVFKLPDDVKIIKQGAFFENDSILEVILPEGLEVIEMGAFARCHNLKRITIPKNVTKIGRNPFELCFNFKSINVAPDNPNYCSVDGCLYDKEMTTLIAVPRGATRLEIPRGVSTIAERALYGCIHLTEVKIPNSVTRIEEESFWGTNALEAIHLPPKLTYIGNRAFGNSNLKAVVIPERVTEIGEYAFSYCLKLVSAVIPDGIKRIAKDTFYNCAALTDVTLPQSLEEIGIGAFDSCKNLSEMNIPNGVKSIGRRAFDDTKLCNESDSDFIILGDGILYKYCGQEQTVVIPDGVKIIGSAFDKRSVFRTVVIPEGVVRIDKEAFSYCHSLSEVVFPKSLKSIGESAFVSCSLSEIHLNEGLEEIGDGAFNGCYFKELILPGTLKKIGKRAFIGGILSDLIISPGVESIDDFAFSGNKLEFVKIPASVSYIGMNPFSHCDPSIRIEIDEANPYYRMIDGCVCTADGKKLVIALPNVPEYPTRVAIPDSITEFGESAFGCCGEFAANLPIESLQSGDHNRDLYCAMFYMSLYEAGDPFFEKTREANNAFIRANCEEFLPRMDIEDTAVVRYMANEGLLNLYSTDFCLRLFEGNVEITAVLLDYRSSHFSKEYLAAYEEEEFKKKIGETERTPEEWKRLFSFEAEEGDACSISGYYGLEKDVTVPGHIKILPLNSIAKECFSPHQYCLSRFLSEARENIRSVIITDGVLNICKSAFRNCVNLSEVLLPPGLLTIRTGAFGNCPRLTEITIPDSVCFISRYTFDNTITIKGTKDSYGIAYAMHYNLKYEII